MAKRTITEEYDAWGNLVRRVVMTEQDVSDYPFTLQLQSPFPVIHGGTVVTMKDGTVTGGQQGNGFIAPVNTGLALTHPSSGLMLVH
jgi:hypothetical protein